MDQEVDGGDGHKNRVIRIGLIGKDDRSQTECVKEQVVSADFPGFVLIEISGEEVSLTQDDVKKHDFLPRELSDQKEGKSRSQCFFQENSCQLLPYRLERRSAL